MSMTLDQRREIRQALEEEMHDAIDAVDGNIADAIALLAISLLEHSVCASLLDGNPAGTTLDTAIGLMREMLPKATERIRGRINTAWH